MNENTVYEERIVAFVDILGFRSLIARTETDQALAENVLWILDCVRGMRDENRAGADPECDVVGRQITIFSDSVVISYPTYSPSCLFYAILDIVHLQMTMFGNGFPMRGGISLGEIHHRQDLAFGPAFISAYDLESGSAIYPRIVITEDTIRRGLTKNPVNIPQEEKKAVLGMLRRDSDELYYVDFLNQRVDTDNDEEYVLLLNKARDMIMTGISSQDASIQQKYEWLKTKYNATVIRQKLEAFAPLV